MPKSQVSTARKSYQKPEIKALTPEAAIRQLKPLALAGDKDARRWIDQITARRRLK